MTDELGRNPFGLPKKTYADLIARVLRTVLQGQEHGREVTIAEITGAVLTSLADDGYAIVPVEMPEDWDGPDKAEVWGVYDQSCGECGMTVKVVATAHSVQNGYAEWFSDPRCSACRGMEAA